MNTDGSKRTLITPQFNTVGAGRAIKLKDITPVCATTKVSKNSITISQIDSSGRTISALDAKWGGSNWTTNGINPSTGKKATFDASEMVILEGTGLYIYNGIAAGNVVTLQSAGEVNTTEDVVIRLNTDGSKRTGMGNPFAVEIDISDIVPEAVTAGTSISKNGITISQIDSSGRTISALDAKWGGSNWTTNGINPSTGKKATFDATGMKIPAGQGLYVYNGIDSAKTLVNLRIKNPLAKDDD